ncbi:hypothetical protein N5C43_08835 [Comamonas terrigena]|uniref:hypothetical protein n=1 Tax=Comamonas terrigena TaxID=32013 RepID=UPI00244746BA|nr:hypothetical protein [Comamonas terrigena]MDH1291363.1 hypothetical protein [Comamonas terrigena]
MAITIEPGDIIAGLALLFSIYATVKTVQFNNRQKSLIESQEKLNKLLLEKETSDSASGRQANIGASFIKLGSSKYRLKIWNKGKAVARNVILEFPEGNDVLIESDIKEKFPLEALDTHQSVELIASVHMETKSKHAIRLIWSDEHSERNEKLVYATL